MGGIAPRAPLSDPRSVLVAVLIPLYALAVLLGFILPSRVGIPTQKAALAFAGRVTSFDTSAGTNHVIKLPTGIEVKDRVLIFSSFNSSGSTTWPAGWTEMYRDTNGSATYGTAWGYQRLCDGTEPWFGSPTPTITVTTVSSWRSASVAIRVVNSSQTQAPEVGVVTQSGGGTTTPDPPALTPTGGLKRYGWVAIVHTDDDASALVSAPANYGNAATVSAAVAHTTTAERLLTASSENPGVFTYDIAESFKTQTCVVYPA